ncbi:peptide-binding protein [Cereibacter changlensis JA139]|uniref:Peptide-binding protein n=2 Tax=Cereibacter changlensis TaxID=402884 RepID=A0A2T4JW91_9RHOB|nr:SH3 domain-containing protein [Cereibacter changlensis]PTE22181.1 peptide-binding protein [Cereibacter changlensis JA139]PZX58629.1 SH3 domain-containing protein [Cereibacter changlensis]
MLRLTFLLCAALFLTLLIGGRDYGQMRPGLAAAVVTPEAEAQPLIQQVEVASLDTEAPALSASAQAAVQLPVPPKPSIVVLPAPERVEPVALAAPVEETMPLLYVTAELVNVRSGPSTRFPVIGRLAEGEAALLVGADEAGWAPIRIEGDGVEGFVSSKYLSSVAPF